MTDRHHIRQLPSGAWQVRMWVEGRNISETFPADPDSLDRPPAAAIRFRDTLDLEARLRHHGLPGMMRPRQYLTYLRDSGLSWGDLAQYVDHNDVRTTQGYARKFLPMRALRSVAKAAEELRTARPCGK